MSDNGNAYSNGHSSARVVLQRVVDILKEADLYAYLHIDDQNRWTVSADTEEGHADIRLGGGLYILETWDTSPGLFWDEEDQRRFHARERRARIVMPALARGLTDPEQEVWWDEQDHGVGARVREYVPFEDLPRLPQLIRTQFDELNRLLADVERRLVD